MELEAPEWVWPLLKGEGLVQVVVTALPSPEVSRDTDISQLDKLTFVRHCKEQEYEA